MEMAEQVDSVQTPTLLDVLLERISAEKFNVWIGSTTLIIYRPPYDNRLTHIIENDETSSRKPDSYGISRLVSCLLSKTNQSVSPCQCQVILNGVSNTGKTQTSLKIIKAIMRKTKPTTDCQEIIDSHIHLRQKLFAGHLILHSFLSNITSANASSTLGNVLLKLFVSVDKGRLSEIRNETKSTYDESSFHNIRPIGCEFSLSIFDDMKNYSVHTPLKNWIFFSLFDYLKEQRKNSDQIPPNDLTDIYDKELKLKQEFSFTYISRAFSILGFSANVINGIFRTLLLISCIAKLEFGHETECVDKNSKLIINYESIIKSSKLLGQTNKSQIDELKIKFERAFLPSNIQTIDEACKLRDQFCTWLFLAVLAVVLKQINSVLSPKTESSTERKYIWSTISILDQKSSENFDPISKSININDFFAEQFKKQALKYYMINEINDGCIIDSQDVLNEIEPGEICIDEKIEEKKIEKKMVKNINNDIQLLQLIMNNFPSVSKLLFKSKCIDDAIKQYSFSYLFNESENDNTMKMVESTAWPQFPNLFPNISQPQSSDIFFYIRCIAPTEVLTYEKNTKNTKNSLNVIGPEDRRLLTKQLKGLLEMCPKDYKLCIMPSVTFNSIMEVLKGLYDDFPPTNFPVTSPRTRALIQSLFRLFANSRKFYKVFELSDYTAVRKSLRSVYTNVPTSIDRYFKIGNHCKTGELIVLFEPHLQNRVNFFLKLTRTTKSSKTRKIKESLRMFLIIHMVTMKKIKQAMLKVFCMVCLINEFRIRANKPAGLDPCLSYTPPKIEFNLSEVWGEKTSSKASSEQASPNNSTHRSYSPGSIEYDQVLKDSYLNNLHNNHMICSKVLNYDLKDKYIPPFKMLLVEQLNEKKNFQLDVSSLNETNEVNLKPDEDTLHIDYDMVLSRQILACAEEFRKANSPYSHTTTSTSTPGSSDNNEKERKKNIKKPISNNRCHGETHNCGLSHCEDIFSHNQHTPCSHYTDDKAHTNTLYHGRCFDECAAVLHKPKCMTENKHCSVISACAIAHEKPYISTAPIHYRTPSAIAQNASMEIIRTLTTGEDEASFTHVDLANYTDFFSSPFTDQLFK